MRIAPRLAFNRPLQDAVRTDELGRHSFKLNGRHFTRTATMAAGKVIGINRWQQRLPRRCRRGRFGGGRYHPKSIPLTRPELQNALGRPSTMS
ncbi:MAG: hypothetical protein EBT08_04070 [Betaproteobacteria bacterium]|nr:hypothetical protein [Betaproteobacteria bacterium]